MSKIGFEFPLDTSQQWDGFNEPGMEHFSGSPFEHLGREAIQNILDAHKAYPVRVEIKLIEVAADSIPDFQGLKKEIGQCSINAVEEGPKASKFFDNAAALLKAKKIKVLQIADYNTKGVVGPCMNGKPFFAMMKATGQSKKADDTATGSYGIGKFAPFTVSGLRTVFLATVWYDQDQKKWIHYVQGKSILMSHQDGKNVKRGTGFWGTKANCLPVEGLGKEIPDWLRRAKSEKELEAATGTTLNIIGFQDTKGWQHILAANIAENFFGAIQAKELEVFIGDDIQITRDTLQGIFENQAISNTLVENGLKNEPEKFNHADAFLKALVENTETITEMTENIHLGRCELRILIGEGLPRKVAFLRNGMMITDQLSGLIRFGEFKEFVAVLECKSNKGKSLLRAMEPPRHDDFEPDRLSSPEEKKQGKAALKALSGWVRDMLRRHAQDPVSEVTNIDELADFFGDEDQEGAGKDRKEENPRGQIIIRARSLPPNKPRRSVVIETPNSSENSDELDTVTDGPITPGPNRPEPGIPGDPNPDPTNTPKNPPTSSPNPSGGNINNNKAPMPIELQNVRAIPISATKRRIIFTPRAAGLLTLEIQDSGADANYELSVIATNMGSIVNGKVEGIKVDSGGRYTLEIELDRKFDGTIRMVANAV